MIHFQLCEHLPGFSVLSVCPYGEAEVAGSALLAVLYVHCSVCKDSAAPVILSCAKQAINREKHE